MIVADTDVLIDALAGRGAAKRVTELLEKGALATTVVSVFELLVGARSEAQRQHIDDLLASVEILAIDEPAGREAASVRRVLAARGLTLPMADRLIAGVCLSRDEQLLTRNRAHFEPIERLRLA